MCNQHLCKLNKLIFAIIITAMAVINSANAIEPLDSIAVVVNDDVITSKELEDKIKYYENQIRLSSGSVSDMDSLRKQVLERMIRDN